MPANQQPAGLRRLDDAFVYVIVRIQPPLPDSRLPQPPSIKVTKDLDVAMELWNFALHKDRADPNLTVAPRHLSREEDQVTVRNYLAYSNVCETKSGLALRDVWVERVPYHAVSSGMADMLRDVGEVTIIYQKRTDNMNPRFWVPIKVYDVWDSDEAATGQMAHIEGLQRKRGTLTKIRMALTGRQEVLVAIAVLGV